MDGSPPVIAYRLPPIGYPHESPCAPAVLIPASGLFSSMNLLVTGGAGFIGSHLVEALIARGDTVSVIDNFDDFYDPAIKRSNLSAFSSPVQIHEIDLCDQAAVVVALAKEKPDVIVHLAARAGVRPSVLSPELYLRTNIFGTFNLLEAARQNGISRFIFASSSSVYGATRELPFREDQALLQTLSPYATTKLAGEHLCSTHSHLYGLQVVCLRFFTVYGPRQRPDLSIHRFTHLIANDKPIEVYGDGSAARDFTYVEDTIQGVLAAIDFRGSPFEIFNLGENDTIDLLSMIHEIEKALGRKATIDFRPPVPGDMPRTCADITKAKKMLNYRPTTRIQQGIPKFVRWYRQKHANK
jgi:UDP-glucuronate 4-epimerase